MIRVLKSTDPHHRNNRPQTQPAAPAQHSAPAFEATRRAFDHTRTEIRARHEAERTELLRRLRA